ncbi:MAG: hypothetical protein ABSB79_00880 [Syntrophales bacterium]|jgi:hypothetical protein
MKLNLNTSGIPAILKDVPQWLCWRKEVRDGKETKVPYQANGQYAKTNDPATWMDYQTVESALNNGAGFDGIGFVLTPNDPFVGIDLDHCRCPAFDDVILPWAREIIDGISSYTEASPSGHGIRIFVKNVTLPPKGRKKGDIEIYESGRYLTVTGHRIPGTPEDIQERTDAVLALHRKIFEDKGQDKSPEVMARSGESVQARLQQAFAAKTGDKIKSLYQGVWTDHPSQSEADLALCCHLAFWLNNDPNLIDAAFRSSGLFREKWDKKHFSNGQTYGQSTIMRAIENTTETYRASNQGTNRQRVEANAGPEAKSGEMKQVEESLAFPSDIMGGVAGKFANLYGDYLEVPKHFLYLSFLTCLGSVLSGALTMATELRPQTRLFLILLGESADDRKSTGINKAVEFFREALTNFNVCFGVGSAEGLQERIKSIEGDGPFRLLLVLDELKQLISKCKIEASVLLPCINTLFESDRYESRTKNSEISIHNAHLCILAASTVSTYERCWDAAFTDIGFNNRLFLVPGQGERRFSFPAKIPDNEKHFLKRDLAEVLAFVGRSRELDLSWQGREAYDYWYMNLEKSVHTKRLDVYALRFMALLAANERKEIVDDDIVDRVTRLMDWQLAVRRLHDPIDADSAVAKVEEKIRRILRTGAKSERDLKKAVHVERTGLWSFTQALKNLSAGREILWNRGNKTFSIGD